MRGNSTVLQGKDLAKEVAALKQQLKSITEALEAEASDGINKVESKGREAIDQAITAAQAFIDDQAESARDAAKALAKKSTEVRDAATESLIESVQARPLGTLAAIIGIGFLAGYLCRRH